MDQSICDCTTRLLLWRRWADREACVHGDVKSNSVGAHADGFHVLVVFAKVLGKLLNELVVVSAVRVAVARVGTETVAHATFAGQRGQRTKTRAGGLGQLSRLCLSLGEGFGHRRFTILRGKLSVVDEAHLARLGAFLLASHSA